MALKILAFGASSSKQSINKKFASFASSLFTNAEVNLIDLNDFAMPLFSVDIEKDFPESARQFAKLIDNTDLILMSMAEHNGAYSAAFKNIFDWVSRIPNRPVFNGKNILLLSTSPGPRGASTSMEAMQKRIPFSGGFVLGAMSLPSFNQNFKEGTGITNPELLQKLKDLVKQVEDKLNIR